LSGRNGGGGDSGRRPALWVFFEPSFLGIIMAFRRTWRTSWPCEQVDWFHVLRCVPRGLIELLYVFNRGFRLLKKIAFL
jgi:hypothetical protein